MRRTWIVAVPLLATSAAAPAANIAPNPGFHNDVSGWTEVIGTELEWSPVDELGQPASGSMKVTVTDLEGDHNLGVLCVPVVAGKTYAFGIDARLPAGQNLSNPRVLASLNWSTGPACNPTFFGAAGTLVELEASWGNSQGWDTAPAGVMSAVVTLRIVVDGSPGPAEVEFDNAFFLEDSTCGSSPTALCLADRRFRVATEWRTPMGAAGYGQARALTQDSGYFWFFDQDNVEIVAKLLDACVTQFNTFWFFAAGLTNVEVTLRVHDTLVDVEKVYSNPLGTPFVPIQDTSAFATCP